MSAVTVKNFGLPLAFAEDALAERVEPASHGCSENQLYFTIQVV